MITQPHKELAFHQYRSLYVCVCYHLYGVYAKTDNK